MNDTELKCPKCGGTSISNIDFVYVLHKEVLYQKDEWYIHNLKQCHLCKANIVI